MARTRIIIDTDPGVDDAVAIMLALASPELDVVAITAVNGNVGLDKTALNARRLVELSGRTDVPVAAGCAVPLAGASGDASEVHGQDGLGDLTWDEPSVQLVTEHAVELMYREAKQERLTIVAVGPLTNVAELLIQHPDIVDYVDRVVIMGGASFEGNVTPAAEFNIWADPEAAEVVVGGSWPLTFMPLDLTHQALINDDDLAFFRSLNTEVGTRLADMLEPYALFHLEWFGNRDLVMHDATAIYEVIDPSAIDKIGVKVTIETSGSHSRGATWFHRSHHNASSIVRVGTSIDNDKFRAVLRERIASYSK
jgi:inosine-uridine nucleoside N-ribohydrolase